MVLFAGVGWSFRHLHGHPSFNLTRSVRAGVCVDHLQRCKTSHVVNDGRGAGGTDETGTNKDTHQLSVIWKQDAVSAYLPPNFCSSCYYQAVSGDSGRPT